jgi:hypothetical protein
VSIGIQDYADLSTATIDRAQRLVTELYATVGVDTMWAETIRPNESVRAPEKPPHTLVVNILTPAMSGRMMVTEGTLGLAAGTRDHGGIVAYVLFDRIYRVARTSASNTADVLGLVIAHELAHLLLPSGSHSRIGLMRPMWDVRDFRNPHRQLFAFTRAQVDGILRLLAQRANPDGAIEFRDKPATSFGRGDMVATGSTEIPNSPR